MLGRLSGLWMNAVLEEGNDPDSVIRSTILDENHLALRRFSQVNRDVLSIPTTCAILEVYAIHVGSPHKF